MVTGIFDLGSWLSGDAPRARRLTLHTPAASWLASSETNASANWTAPVTLDERQTSG